MTDAESQQRKLKKGKKKKKKSYIVILPLVYELHLIVDTFKLIVNTF